MKRVYVGFSFAHHKNSQGGYHHIKDYLHYDTIIDAQWEKEFYESTSKNILFRVLRRLYIFLLGHGTPFTVIKCIFFALFRKDQIFHFIYGENSYKWLHHFKGKSNKIVCTFHQPASYFVEHEAWLPILKKLDAIILMTEKDVPQFMQWTGKDNVFFIPHGVNCNYYKPNKDIVKQNSILMVGNWLRDFELATKVFSIIKTQRHDVAIKVVTGKVNFQYFSNMDVELFVGISDDELRHLYQSSKIVFFPLLAFTANNALLEAASCGCNILVSVPTQIDESYFSEDYITFLNNSIDEVVQKLYQLLKENTFDESVRIHSYVKNNFSWEVVGDKTIKVIER